MRERLIELLQEFTDNNNGGGSNHRRADYLLENGVLVPPCKVGDEVYFVCVDENCEDYIDKGKVYAISQNENTLWFSVRYLSGLRYDHTSSDFGKTLFFTKEEAERALKGGEG